ncbi:LamG-like jellyroll fold domain-containing protein [Crossiella sp. CA198]|uniref:LamG-like jellyroll fold domain-containing protein n=1 Tax=Crossiella sp. CA198 TaxID=3455607 RepID=UPI003F8D098C
MADWGKTREIITAALIAAVTATMLTTTNTAKSTMANTAEVGAKPGFVAEAPDEHTAMIAAARQGTKVEITGLKNERSRFFANPTGSVTMDQSLMPERVRRGDKWVDIDPALAARPDGTIGPKATLTEVAFSGGGTGPFARITAAGSEIALSWPRALPRPVLDGATATYPDVLPGTDLRARVTQDGFTHELVVRTREAAANPALAKVTFGIAAKGVRLSTDPTGRLTAVDDKGRTVFSAPAATMWDSAGDGKRKTAGVRVEAGAGHLSLTPDRALLADPAAVLPIIIDPQYSYHSVWQSGWTLVRSVWPATTHWNMQPEDLGATRLGVARTGVSPDGGRGSIDRAYFQFDTAPLAGAVINQAHFNIKQGWKYAHSCNPGDVPWLDLHWTNGIHPGTTWNNQPGMNDGNRVGQTQPVAKYGQPCGPDWVGYNVVGQVQHIANTGQSAITFGLKDRTESGTAGWKRFYVQKEENGTDSFPHIWVEFNRRPDKPTELSTDPLITSSCANCAGKSYVNSARMIFGGRVADPDGGSVNATITLFNPKVKEHEQTTDWVPSGLRVASAFDLTRYNGQGVSWSMKAHDGALTGERASGGQEFYVDLSVPEVGPTVAGTLYRQDNEWNGGAGVPDRFTFGPRGVIDIDRYEYTFAGKTGSVNANGLGGTATVTLTPPTDGPLVLLVRSVDRAGNRSAEQTEYKFQVRPGNGPKSQWPLDSHGRDEAYLGDRDATLHGGATWTEAGAVGAAVQLDGKTGHLRAPNAVRTDAGFTVSAWVNLAKLPQPPKAGEHAIAVSQQGNRFPGFALWHMQSNEGPRWAFGMGRSDTEDKPSDLAVSEVGKPQRGDWTHLTGVYDAHGGVLRLYVNGIHAQTTPRTVPSWNATGELRIGHATWNGTPETYRWQGAVDEVRVYDRVLSGLDVRTLVGLDNVQTGQWRFEDQTGVTARNSIRGGQHLTLRNGAAFERGGPVGNALKLDGTNDTAETGDQVLRTDQSFSVGAWVNLSPAAPLCEGARAPRCLRTAVGAAGSSSASAG